MSWDRDGSYAMGWGVVPAADPASGPGYCRNPRFYVGHTGGAVGASSALVILPRKSEDVTDSPPENTSQLPLPPRGVVVAIIVNMQSASLNKTALKVAKLFDSVSVDRKG
jgi:serine beta-lactamase-like protein LACTB, mitochondrial